MVEYEGAGGLAVPVYNRLEAFSLQRQREILPIYRHRLSLLYTVEHSCVTIVCGHTGCGKSTQIPQYLYEAGWAEQGRQIGCTQPRRVAATSVAARVAQELGCGLGATVGYSIRFENMTTEATKIKYLTDGMLLQEALFDPLLTAYSVIMLDEAHERSLYTDILLGLLIRIRKKRPELRLIVSSATLDAEAFKHYFTKYGVEEDSISIVSLEGRMYPVDIQYLKQPTENYLRAAVNTVSAIHESEPAGDILVFLTGREEIYSAVQEIQTRAKNSSTLKVLPLYAGLPTDQQAGVFEPSVESTIRKVIVSTNVAEASVTIDGIVYVIDSGFVKLRGYDPVAGFESLVVSPISKASANQRTGRAGRTKPGKCYRLYTEEAFVRLDASTPPEIQRSDMAPVILQLKSLGIDNVVRFHYMTSPPAETVKSAFELLYSLGAIDEYGKLTPSIGIKMSEIPLPPAFAKILLASGDLACAEQMLSILAMSSVENIFISSESKSTGDSVKRKFSVEEGDHLTLLNVYQSFVLNGDKSAKWCHQNLLNYKSMMRAVSIRAQLVRYMQRLNIPIKSTAIHENASIVIRKCLVSGLFSHAAKMQPDGSFRSASLTLYCHPSSMMFNRKADWVIFSEVVEHQNKIYIRDLSKIEMSWLLEMA